jgi:NADPH2:quinone reductase
MTAQTGEQEQACMHAQTLATGNKMRALVAAPDQEWGIALRDIDPPSRGKSDAMIEVASFSINRGELMLLKRAEPGWVGGWDLAGRVAQPAADGSGPPAGSRVLGYLPRHGGWAELAAVPSSQLAVIPDEISYAQAIGLAVPGVVALRVIQMAGPIVGREMLATGAFLGGGRILLQLARLGGAKTTVALAGSPAPGFAEELLGFGADEVVIGTATLLAQGRDFDPILEAAGGDTTRDVIDLLKPGGTIITFGNSSGLATNFRLDVFNKKQPRMIGYYMPTNTEEHPVAEDLKTLFRLTVAGKISPSIGLEMAWEEASEAVKRLSTLDWGGKLVLHVR